MAKLKAPLLSLGASQQLGKTIVFFAWKGLNVAREYVIPSNPRTAPQTTQRGYLTDAVAFVHQAQALAADALGATDVTAYALWAGVVQAATTWFNQAIRNYVDQKVAGKDGQVFCGGVVTPGAGQITLELHMLGDVPGVTNCDIYYGTSRTALIHTQGTTKLLLAAGVVIAGLTAGVKYFFQVRPTAPAGQVGNRSGIYYGTPT